MMDLKKIAGEISDKCGTDSTVSVHLYGNRCGYTSHDILLNIGGNQLHGGLDVPTHEGVSEAAHKVADQWLDGKAERDAEELEAARTLLAKHGEVSS